MALDANTSQQPLTPETRRGLPARLCRPHAAQSHGHGRSRGHAGHRARRPASPPSSSASTAAATAPRPTPPIRAKLKPTAPATRPTPSSRVSPWPAPCDGCEKCRKDLGRWWDAAETASDTQTQALATAPGLPQVAAKPVPTPGGPGSGANPSPCAACRPDATGTPDRRRNKDRSCRRAAPAPSGTGRSQASRHAPVFPQDHTNLRPPGHLCRLHRRHCQLAGCPRLRPHAGRRRATGNATRQPRPASRINH